MNFMKKKGLYYIFLLLAAILSVVTVILGSTQKAMTTNNNFSIPLTVVLIVGIVVVALNLFIELDFMALVASILFSVGFGMIVNEGLPVIVDKINSISFQGGNFNCVAAYVGMMLVACVLSFIACFTKKKEN